MDNDTKKFLKEAVIDAFKQHHICDKEDDIAQLHATCKRITDFTNEARETNTKLGEALEKLAVGDERLRSISLGLERNEKEHENILKRIQNLAIRVEHEHDPIIKGIVGFGKFAKALALTIITLLSIGVGMLLMEEWAEHKALENAVVKPHVTEQGRP